MGFDINNVEHSGSITIANNYMADIHISFHSTSLQYMGINR
jgi:hypothetical protein